ncbi:hypothetical protein FJZ33_04960 [Candidatus Poribacteria bacterium]|nr:hypothetical protein [Candidatus Poribacteria bacterium]
MARNKTKKLTSFESLDELVDFFDTHDLGEYLDGMLEAKFDVDIKKRIHLFALDSEIADELTKIAKLRHISSEMLINTWLKDKIQEKL